MAFPAAGPLGRHPTQLYEALLEGPVLFVLLAFMFWKIEARYQPGKLVGTFALGYGHSRFFVEFFREPDRGLETLSWGLTMGQTLTVPMIVAGLIPDRYRQWARGAGGADRGHGKRRLTIRAGDARSPQ